MERPVFKPVGTPVEQLDTPVLLVELSTMEQNLENLGSFFNRSAAKARPHVSAHRCPAIAHKQLAAGGTVGGISVSSVGEAEVFASAGITDILVASQVVTRPKIRRLCSLARGSKIAVAVDSAENVRDLSEAAQSEGVTIHALVEVDIGLGHSGLEPGSGAETLARQVAGAQGLHFGGLMANQSNAGHAEEPESAADGADALRPVLETRQLIERARLEVETVSIGGSPDYEIAGATKGVTEVRVGYAPLMDHNHCQYVRQLVPAARVMATVISHPTEEYVIADCGHKATGPDLGLPVLEGIPGARVTRVSAEHGIVELEGEARGVVDVGAKLWLIPWDLGLCVNQYDYFHAIRDGRLEAVWGIAARGRWD